LANISGMSSGLDTENIISSLMAIKRQQVTNLTTKRDKAQAKESTWGSISADLVSLQLSNYNLSRSATFGVKRAVSSNEDILSLSASVSANAGSYSFYVNKLAQSSQLTSAGFSDSSTTKLATTTKQITIESGNAKLQRYTELSSLNGGSGVTRGSIYVQDRDGNGTTLDLSTAQDIYEVIDAINGSGLKLSAEVNSAGDGINVSYTGSSTSSNLIVRNAGNGTMATGLGIDTGSAGVAANQKAGSSVYYLASNMSLSQLNSGLGAEKGSFVLNNGGSNYTIDISGAKTVGEVVSLINASGSGITASISVDKKSINLSGTNITVSESGNSKVAKDLGLMGITGTGSDGTAIVGGLGSVLSASLYGATGNGIRAGTFDVVGDVTRTITVTAKDSIIEIIKKVNAVSTDTGVSARINNSGNGIELYKGSGTSFTITDSNTSRDLGLYAVTNSGSSVNGEISGSSLGFKYFNRSTLLADLNQGVGFKRGSISITNSDGNKFNVNLSSTSLTNIGQVIDAINTASTGGSYHVTASINSTGDGLLITDTNGGNITVAENGTAGTAKSLGILGSDTDGTVDGSFKKTVSVTSDYTLVDLQAEINNLGINLSASIINDGSSDPYRLVLTSSKSGRNGSFIVSSEIDALQFNTAVEAEDSLITMGEPSSSQAIFVKNSSNTVSNFISGMTLNLKEASESQVTVTVTNNYEEITTIAEEFVDNYNAVMDKIKEQLSYNSESGVTNPLFGDTNLMLVQQDLFSYISKGASELSGSIKSVSQVGMTLELDGTLSFNKTEFNQALQDDFEDVKDFFTYNYNATASAALTTSSTTAGNINGVKDGNTSETALLAGTTGWQGASGSNIEMDFGKKIDITSLTMFGTDTNPNDVVSSLVLQYWNGSSWADHTTVTNNTKKDITFNALSGLYASKIRFNNMTTVGGGDVKLAEIQAFQPVGLSKYFDYKISSITDASTGSISNAMDNTSEEMQMIDGQIESMEERLAIEEERLRKQFTELEKMMGQMGNTSTWLSQQTIALNANWK